MISASFGTPRTDDFGPWQTPSEGQERMISAPWRTPPEEPHPLEKLIISPGSELFPVSFGFPCSYGKGVDTETP